MAMHNGDVKMLLVAYVSGFIASRLLHDGNCNACKGVRYLKHRHQPIFVQASRNATVQYIL